MCHQSMIAFFGLPGGLEWIVIGGIALLIFGRRLPDAARAIGRSVVEFKNGIRETKDEIQAEVGLADTAESLLSGGR